ncbi:MAG: hypothetical protein ACQESN_09295 [Thermotogota bacterium]
MKKIILFILVFTTAILFVSCIPTQETDNNDDTTTTEDDNGSSMLSKEITLMTYYEYTPQNMDFVAFKNGNSGEWQKITGASGQYNISAESTTGNLSIFLVNSYLINDVENHDIKIFNINQSDSDLIPIYFSDSTYTLDSTLNMVFDSGFEGKTIAYLYGDEHGWGREITTENKTVEHGFYKGTNDLAILSSIDNTTDYSKIYIDRDVSIDGETQVNINYSDLVALETFKATTTIEEAYTGSNLFIGGSTILYNSPWWNETYLRIPDSIREVDDIYQIYVGKTVNSFEYYNSKFISDPEDIESINSLPTPSWSVPTLENNIITWNDYSSGIDGHELRLFEIDFYNSENTVNWEITFTTSWLEDSGYYTYQLPELTSLEGWDTNWIENDLELYPNIIAISTNNENINQISNPVPGYEISYISYSNY